jgi:hypothetical protein
MQPDKRKKEIRRIDKTDRPPMYCDSVRIHMGNYGFKLFFGNLTDATDTTVEIVEQVAIGMSPEHAVVLHRLLGEHLQTFEKLAGPLRSPQTISDENEKEAGE